MKKIECVIADDEALSRDILRAYIEKTPSLRLIAECRNGIEVFGILNSRSVDLLFLDIQMPLLTGIELLKTMQHPPRVVLVTAYREYALEGYELNVMDYLLKPVPYTRFLQAVNKFQVHRPPSADHDSQPDFIDIKADKKILRISLDSITFLESMKDYVRINTEDGPILTHQTLTQFEETLPGHQFIRVHRSYIISLKKVTAFSPSFVEIGKRQIPVGAFYQQQALRRLSSH